MHWNVLIAGVKTLAIVNPDYLAFFSADKKIVSPLCSRKYYQMVSFHEPHPDSGYMAENRQNNLNDSLKALGGMARSSLTSWYNLKPTVRYVSGQWRKVVVDDCALSKNSDCQ